MSSGAFVRSRYEANNDEIHPIRVQPETISLIVGGVANTPPTGATTSRISARVSGSARRQLGLTARSVRFTWLAAVPDGYEPNGTLRLPLLNQAIYDAIEDGAETGTISIGGTSFDISVSGISPEGRR